MTFEARWRELTVNTSFNKSAAKSLWDYQQAKIDELAKKLLIFAEDLDNADKRYDILQGKVGELQKHYDNSIAELNKVLKSKAFAMLVNEQLQSKINRAVKILKESGQWDYHSGIAILTEETKE